MKNMKNKVGYLIILCLVLSFTIQVININPIKNTNELSNVRGLNISTDVTHSKEWIKNGNFTSQEYWNSTKGELGDPEDVDSNISGGYANYEVLGFDDRFAFEENYDMGASWVETNHPSFPVDPTFGNIVAGEGFRAEHSWDDQNANQVPSVQWEQNFSLPVNMSDYIITSASVSAGLNATVDSNIDTVADGVAGNSARTGGYNVDTYSIGDYIRFYVSISDLQKTKIYEIAYTQSATLGDGGAGSTDNLAQQFMSTLSQADLIYYLSSVLETDYRNFTLIVGIRFNCEDNVATFYDLDDFNRAIINSINLTFDYEKKIDRLTSLSWNQEGDKPNDISSNPIVIDKAILNFKYNISDTWPSSSPNSEIKILINDIPHSETIKLSTATISFQEAKSGGFDLTSLISVDEKINLTLQVYLADEFELNRTITISIDDVSLNITYTEDVPDILTNMQLFLNRENKTDDPVISLPLGVNLNVTIKYTNQSGDHIPGADVQLEGKVNVPLSENFTLQQYSTIINTSLLGIGVKILTVKAQKEIYESQNIPFFVEVSERETELQLFLNGVPKSDSDTIQVEIDDLINITVYFKDNITKNYLSGATISLLGIGSLDETGQHYNITLSANDLDQGISILTIFAQLVNYTPKSIKFFVEVVERSTELQLFLNGEDMTDDPVFDLPIGTILNITLKYDDNQTGLHINGATLQFIGESLSVSLTENLILEQYYLILTTTDLKIGVNLFTIVAHANNFQIRTMDLRITVNRIRTIISTTSGESYINALPGGSIRLKIRLNNTDFGGLIKNATVTYRWAYGQGELLDIDNDGVYEVELKNIPVGIYAIIISASAGDYYDFESYEITLNAVAVSGPDFTMLFLTLSGAFVALVVGFTLYQVHFKYPPTVRKSRKIRKKIRKGKKTKPVKDIASREDLIKDHIESNVETIQLEKKTENGLKEK